MIIDRIKRHNIINGFLFSFVEFAIIAILLGGFAVYAFMHNRPLIGLSALGIALNCFPVMFLSFRSLRAKEQSIGFKGWFNGSNLALIARKYPETSVDTSAIVVATAVPFLALILTLVDVLRRR